MQDKLKELFDSQENLDTHEPNLGHRERFSQRLEEEMGHKPEGVQLNISFKFMRIAAIAVVLVTAISFAWFWDQSSNSIEPVQKAMTLADVSDKYKQVESFYQEQMSARLVKLEAEDAAMEQVTYKEALSKLESLELEYTRLENDLAKNPGNTRIVFAMIKNYQLRITVLETLLQKLNIEETQKHEENEKANVSPHFFLWAFILFLSLPSQAIAKSEEVSKTVEKVISVNKDARLNISNQFGKVDLINHDKNEVDIYVKITVEGNSESKAQDKLDKIDVEVNGSASLVDISTHIKNNSNFKGSFSIDYTIKAPPTMILDLENQFGDVFVGEWEGPAEIEVQYGNLTAGKLKNERNSVELQFSKGSIGLINKGEIELAYADRFSLDRATELNIRSSFSQVEIETVEVLDVRSEYDGVEIGEVNRLNLDAGFSSVEIDKLYIQGDVSNEYGSIKIDWVSKDFEGLDVENAFASIKVYFEKGSQFTFECEAEYGDIDIPSGSEVRIDRKDHTDHYMKGYFGSETGVPHVSVEVDYGGARLDIK